jgi:uncharacterized protein involved in response to NO
MKRVQLSDLGKEPFRVFFPEGVLAGVLGVVLWPLYVFKVVSLYPGESHGRIMAYGLFGAFIFGFLGTAMPRLLSAPPLGARNVLPLLTLHLSMLVAYAIQKTFVGDVLFLVILIFFAGLMLMRLRHRQDTPPPGFVLVALAFLCVLAGGVIALFEPSMEDAAAYWVPLQKRLSYQGFVLLPILGIGPFILPRFFGLPNPHDFPETLAPTSTWKKKAAFAAMIGMVIIASFFVESAGRTRLAHSLRFSATLIYLLVEFPFRLAPKMTNALGIALRLAFVMLVSGFILVAIFPAYRVGLLHLTLVGGFAVITFTVATRVLFGHSGNLEKLKLRNRWLLVAVGLMLFGMATRISGDFWPRIMFSHYSYGALAWLVGVGIWAFFALPKVMQVED